MEDADLTPEQHQSSERTDTNLGPENTNFDTRLRAAEISLSAILERLDFHTQQISCIKANVEKLVEKIDKLTVEMAHTTASQMATRRMVTTLSTGISLAVSIAGVIVAILI